MNATHLALERADFFVRNVHTRLPFRYGKATLVAMPVLHVRLLCRDENKTQSEGCSADCLPPKWFDKSPEKSFRINVEDLLKAIRIGAKIYQEEAATPDSVFSIWHRAHPRTVDASAREGLNALSGSFGSSLMERALMDAACKLAGSGFGNWVREGGLGLDPGSIHAELQGFSAQLAFAVPPPKHLFIRHTVGLADPVWEADIARQDHLDDGLPQSLEGWVKEAGIRYFKVKVVNDLSLDLPRLSSIGGLLERFAQPGYRVSLDGNEQFKNVGEFKSWLEALSAEENLRPFWKSILYFEQPIDRNAALDPSTASGLHNLPTPAPIIIDESDDSMGAFKQAVSLGYRGTSVKNCKGPIKGMLNKMLAGYFNQCHGGGFLLTGEDLANIPVVPLQQDLATLSLLGLEHAERNGHHYFHGLDHLSEKERADCLSRHGDLYEPFGASGKLCIRDGRINLASLLGDGYGSCGKPDVGDLTPLGDWDFASLGAD
jgi:hypothetical protein